MMTFTPPKFVLAFAGLASLSMTAAVTAFAQSAKTDPVGVTTVHLIAGNPTTPPSQYIGLGMAKPAVFQGKVTGSTIVSGTSQLTFAANSFADNAYDPVGGNTAYYAEVLNGSGAGVISHIIQTDPNVILLSDDISSAVTAGTTQVRIRKFWTVAEAFGANNTAGFLGASSPSNADVITISYSEGTTTNIFYNTSTSRFEKVSDNSNASDLPIPVDAGLFVLRRDSTAKSFKIAGDVKLGPTALWVNGGSSDTTTVLQNPYPLGNVMLKDSGLYTGNATTGVAAGSATTADLVTIQDPETGETNNFYFDTSTQRWRTGFTDASLIKIPENASIAVTRRAGRGAFNWFAQQPLMALDDTPLPLQLISAVSRKTHGTSGTWDVNLPLSGATGIEPRSGGSSNAHTVVFTFSGASDSNPITSANVSVQSGVATISGSPILNGNTITVNLTGVNNAQTVNLQVANVQAQNGQTFASATVPMGVLRGDVNYNGAVSATDITQVRLASSLQPVNFGNFRGDVNTSSTITASDVTQVRLSSGTSINP